MTRVLYVNQTGAMSGAERSLLELLSGLPPDRVVGVACPEGPLAEALASRGVRRWALSGTEVSFRLHPTHTARGLARIAVDALRLRSVVRRSRPDLLHANTLRAGLISLLATSLGGPGVVVHVRDWLPESRVARWTVALVTRRAAAVVANSVHMARQLPPTSRRTPVVVIHNPVDTEQFDPARFDRHGARRSLGAPSDAPLIAVVGQLTPWKGLADAVHVLARLRGTHPELRLAIVGSAKFSDAGTRFDNRAYAAELRDLVARLGLTERVVMVGETDRVPEVLAAIDILLVPSWHEAFGRVALEGMAMGVPVVATSNGGPAELLEGGIGGKVLAPRDHDRWASAVAELLDDEERRTSLGRQGRRRAVAEYAVAMHAERVTTLHDQLMG